jgi:hypothetical protein
VDFPCFVRYDEARQCVDYSNSWIKPKEASIEVFLSTYEAGWSGGGCNTESSATDTLTMDTPAGELVFERQGDELFVNGNALKAGQPFQKMNRLSPNLWLEYNLNFTNFGSVPVCESSLAPRHVIIGSYGSQISYLKGFGVLSVLLAGAIFSAILFFITFRVGKKQPPEQKPEL